MALQVIMMIDEGYPKSEVYAHASKNDSGIVIKAKSLDEAKALLPQGEELEKKARQEYSPENDNEELPLEHTYKAPMSSEQAQREIERYMQDKEGARFVKALNTAWDFSEKKDKTGFFNIWQYRYLALVASATDPHEAIIKSYTYGYHKGYKKAKNELKQRKE